MSEGKTLDDLIQETKGSEKKPTTGAKREGGKKITPARRGFAARKRGGLKPGAQIARRQGNQAKGRLPQKQGKGGV